MPRVSVLVPTMRVGGIDIILHGLAGQTFKDLELVLSDGIWGRRHDKVEELARSYGVRVKHVEPLNNPFPVNAFCRYANATVRGASLDSEISLIMTDYTWLPPDCVARHVAVHEHNPSGHAHAGPHQYVQLPALSPFFAPYGQEDTDKYVADLESGSLDPVMTSILLFPFDADASSLPPCPVQGGLLDPKLQLPAGPMLPRYFHAKNESVRIADLLAVNGWDEDLDEAHCYQDTELAERLATHRGTSWTVDPTNIAFIVNPRTVFPFPRRLHPVSRNEAIWRNKEARGYPLPPPLFTPSST